MKRGVFTRNENKNVIRMTLRSLLDLWDDMIGHDIQSNIEIIISQYSAIKTFPHLA